MELNLTSYNYSLLQYRLIQGEVDIEKEHRD